jgi:hypothetical protein
VKKIIKKILNEVKSKPLEKGEGRENFWINFLNIMKCNNFCEIGVYKGKFSKKILSNVDSIEKYYMIDPWKHLNNWNKPANHDDSIFKSMYDDVMELTKNYSNKRIVLRDQTKNIIHKIENESLDFVYIDGDHTLRGITLDLHLSLSKVRKGGIIAGDDLAKQIWRHGNSYSPTQVFPYVLYFAELHNFKIYLLPWMQFFMVKESTGFEVIDFDNYLDLSLKDIYRGGPS